MPLKRFPIPVVVTLLEEEGPKVNPHLVTVPLASAVAGDGVAVPVVELGARES